MNNPVLFATMRSFKSINDVLEFAIEQEEKEVEFYSNLADKMTNHKVKRLFEDLSLAKQAHMLKLEAIRINKSYHNFPDERVRDLRVDRYMAEVDYSNPNPSYEEALAMAMAKEKATFLFYWDLSQSAEPKELRNIFHLLALEEAKQKLKFEIEFDEHHQFDERDLEIGDE